MEEEKTMGREVRRVPPNWKHPSRLNYGSRGIEQRYIPLYPWPYLVAREDWLTQLDKWRSGTHKYQVEWGCSGDAWDHIGMPPRREEHMPDWPRQVCTHYQMYENTSEGTPISPVMETPEELARWLADNGVSSFVDMTATYEQWLPICKGGWAPSMVISCGEMKSGVEAIVE